jgi:hypothetical protein
LGIDAVTKEERERESGLQKEDEGCDDRQRVKTKQPKETP